MPAAVRRAHGGGAVLTGLPGLTHGRVAELAARGVPA
jgi:hypothetical protein